MAKYQRSVKAQLTLFLFTSVCVSLLIVITLTIIYTNFYLNHLIDTTKEQIESFQAGRKSISMLQKGTQIANRFQESLNEVQVASFGEALAGSGLVAAKGDQLTRPWSLNLTDFTQRQHTFYKDKYYTASGAFKLNNTGNLLNKPDEMKFADLKAEAQTELLGTQMADAIKFPFFENGSGDAYAMYTGFQKTGLFYDMLNVWPEYVEYTQEEWDKVDANQRLFAPSPPNLKQRPQTYTQYQRDKKLESNYKQQVGQESPSTPNQQDECEVPQIERNAMYECRCRPWYLSSVKDPGAAQLTTYPLEDTWCTTISKGFQNPLTKELLGVVGVDLDTSFIETIMNEAQQGREQEFREFYVVNVPDTMVMFKSGGLTFNSTESKTLSEAIFGTPESGSKKWQEQQSFNQQVNPILQETTSGQPHTQTTDGSTHIFPAIPYTVEGKIQKILILNVFLRTRDLRQPTGTQHTLSVCVILDQVSVEVKLTTIFFVILGLSVLGIILFGIMTIVCTFSISHRLMRPLRRLNEKMKEVVISSDAGVSNDLKQVEASREIVSLYSMFSDLIQDRMFSQNTFLKRDDSEDVISVMDLAETCLMYTKEANYKAAGVCFNNIANLHMKHGKYSIAEENFISAIQMADKCLAKATVQNESESFREVRAHRVFQLAMCKYKHLRYGEGRGSVTLQQNLNTPQQNREISKQIYEVLESLDEAFQSYEAIKVILGNERQSRRQAKYIDLKIRIILAKSYMLNVQQKPFKASNLLAEVESLLGEIKDGYKMIVEDAKMRCGAFHYSYEILYQKYLLMKGLWQMKNLQNKALAINTFIQCLKMGKSYDPRIHLECQKRIKELLKEQKRARCLPLDLHISNLKHRKRDFVFMVDLSSPISPRGKAELQSAINQIFNEHVEGHDRVSLVQTLSEQNTRKIFSLVPKKTNKVQLQNQIYQATDISHENGEVIRQDSSHSFVQPQPDLARQDLLSSNPTSKRLINLHARSAMTTNLTSLSAHKHGRLFAKGIKTSLMEFNNIAARKWLLIFCQNVPDLGIKPPHQNQEQEVFGVSQNLNAKLDSNPIYEGIKRLGKNNINVMFVVHNLNQTQKQHNLFLTFKRLMNENQATHNQQVISGLQSCHFLVNPTCSQIQSEMEAIENKRMEYNHPLIYETFI